MDKLLEKRLKLANLPTPIEKLKRLSAELDGPNIYIKRDDLTGLELTGNKVRKLEYALADAIEQKVDVIITCGGIQSNHMRTCAVAAAKLGIKAHLVVWGDKEYGVKGNYLLNCLAGAEFSYYQAESLEEMNKYMDKLAQEYKSKGFNPKVIPLGVNMPLGILGYVNAVKEMHRQFQEYNLSINYIVLPVGTSSTYLGILMGIKYYQLPIKVIGINVTDKGMDYTETLRVEWQNFCDYFNYNAEFNPSDIEIIPDYVGQGYGVEQKEITEVIENMARTEGIFMDHVYAGKAMYGLCEEIKKNRFKEEDNILFVHTGGIFELFK